MVCEVDETRRQFVRENYPGVHVVDPDVCRETVTQLTESRGADRVIEVAGTRDSFRMAWMAARPNAIVTIVALYDESMIFPLPEMYGKNLTFKTGGVDGCYCDNIMRHIAEGHIDTTRLITHRYPLSKIEEAYTLFEERRDNVIKIVIYPD